MTTILAVLAFFEVGLNNIPVTIELFRWIDSEWFNINWGFNLDSLTVSSVIIIKYIFLCSVGNPTLYGDFNRIINVNWKSHPSKLFTNQSQCQCFGLVPF
jgi:hypothetical protein